jgi:hypothetical protein
VNPFDEAFAQDVDAIFAGEFGEDVTRIERDGSRSTVAAVTQFVSERIVTTADGEEVVTTRRFLVPAAQRPEIEEVWIHDGVRYAVTGLGDLTPQWCQFDGEHWATRRKQKRGTTAG